MAKISFQSIDEYIAAQPETARSILQSVRGAIRMALPTAEEAISYNIPACKVNGEAILWFAGWKRHYSLYPAGERLRTAFRNELAPYEIDKSTIRFPITGPVPEELIGRIAAFRVQEAAENGKRAPKKAAANVPAADSPSR